MQPPIAPQPPKQTPPEHAWPAGQALPHAPQLALSLARFFSQPSASILLQSANPFAHAPIAHAPPMHVTLACAAGAHTVLHEPQ